MSEVSPIKLSHDSANRWLRKSRFRPRDLWDIAKKKFNPEEKGILVCDDTVLDKSRSSKIEIVSRQYSGNAHSVIPGISVVNLLWASAESSEFMPLDYRVYDVKTDGKTKNDHFRNMLGLAKFRRVNPLSVVMDTWYSGLENLKAIRDYGWTWLTMLRCNRIVNNNTPLSQLAIPEEGLLVHLRGYGFITVFKFVAKNRRIDYFATNLDHPTREQVASLMKSRWNVEVYHRELKQNCGIERCQSRSGRAQRNHIFLAISAWFQQHCRRLLEGVTLYQQKWDSIKDSVSKFLIALLTQSPLNSS